MEGPFGVGGTAGVRSEAGKGRAGFRAQGRAARLEHVGSIKVVESKSGKVDGS